MISVSGDSGLSTCSTFIFTLSLTKPAAKALAAHFGPRNRLSGGNDAGMAILGNRVEIGAQVHLLGLFGNGFENEAIACCFTQVRQQAVLSCDFFRMSLTSPILTIHQSIHRLIHAHVTAR
ncbi:MAG: hypothetical protein Q8O52_15615 [Sulfuritalea sp.]|nr:hypothetical protein [Sulfuritalea sp.]